MRVKIEVYKRSFKLCAESLINRESCTGYLCRGCGIEYSKLLAQIPVRLRLKVKLCRLHESSYLNIVRIGVAVRNGRIREIRNCVHDFLNLCVKLSYLVIILLYVIGQNLHFGKNRRSVLALFFQSGNLL